jgi:hypothetical protein
MAAKGQIRWHRWIAVVRWVGVAFALLAVAAIVFLLVIGAESG